MTKSGNIEMQKSLFYLHKSYVFEVWGINRGLKNLAKSDSGFEDVSRSIFVDLGAILTSILAPKINKNRTKNQVNFGSDLGCDFGRF